jgi:hypothetical protein
MQSARPAANFDTRDDIMFSLSTDTSNGRTRSPGTDELALSDQ